MGRRKTKSCILGAIAVLTIAIPGYLLRPQTNHIRLDRMSLILTGMTKTEVEQILGVPSGDYSNGTNRMTVWHNTDDLEPGWYFEAWRTEYSMCQVYFDAKGRVLFWGGGNVSPPSWIERVKWWLMSTISQIVA